MANGEDIAKKLLDLKKRIDSAKQDKAKLEGQLEAHLAELKKFGANSIEEAESLRQALEVQMADKTKQFERLYEEIENVL